jgi:hypothetical protein
MDDIKYIIPQIENYDDQVSGDWELRKSDGEKPGTNYQEVEDRRYFAYALNQWPSFERN